MKGRIEVTPEDPRLGAYRTDLFRVLGYAPTPERDIGHSIRSLTRAVGLDPVWWRLEVEVYPVTPAEELDLLGAVGTEVSVVMLERAGLSDDEGIVWPGDVIVTWPGGWEIAWPGASDPGSVRPTQFVLWNRLLEGVLVSARPTFVGADRAQGFRWRIVAEVTLDG